jgi:hypothetical protein
MPGPGVTGRGRTGAGRPAELPVGAYEPPPAIHGPAQGLVVDFTGEDGRTCRFHIAALPLPGWHPALAASWAARTGPGGSLRTKASAIGNWSILAQLIRFLAQRPRPPAEPQNLAAEDLEVFRRHREASVGAIMAAQEMRNLGKVFLIAPLRDLVPSAALDRLRERSPGNLVPKSGYSDAELAKIVTAARSDVARVRRRLTLTTGLLHRYQQDPDQLTSQDRDHAATLAAVARTGVAAVPVTRVAQALAARTELARQVFVTRQDLVPMLVLLVATTGRNIETIKELPAEHKVLEGLAVELEIIKRRRGSRRWHSTVTWEIGPPSRELHTPGGLYLLLHRLMAPARALLETPAFWAVWHSRYSPLDLEQGCRNPFAENLNPKLYLARWIRSHGLRADQPASASTPMAPARAEEQPALLGLDFNRLKTSIDVRRTRQLGGHLPSAARTNTMPVLFSNYLRGDQTTIDWAQGVVSEAFAEVEQSAFAAHRRALEASGRTMLQVVPASDPVQALTDAGLDQTTAQRAAAGDLDTAWTACRDHEHHPITGKRCSLSFLDCFHCANCLITHAHLPQLLSLLDALQARRPQMSGEAWWTRYGPAWAAVRFEVLPKFSQAELDRAASVKPQDGLLDLIEPRWEHP